MVVVCLFVLNTKGLGSLCSKHVFCVHIHVPGLVQLHIILEEKPVK